METSRRQRKHESLLSAWLAVGVILIIMTIVALFAVTAINERQQTQRDIREYICGVGYERYTTEWQACVDR